MSQAPRILYCHCAYAQVVPKDVKEAVLRRLAEAGIAFEAVADLCEMSARRDPALKRLASGVALDAGPGTGGVKIAACFPRAVKWLFSAAQAPLSHEQTEVLNMRTLTADDVVRALLESPLQPNLPTGKVTEADAPSPTAGSPA
jgi:hypothetical protein